MMIKVRIAKSSCLDSFSSCKKAEDASIGLIHICGGGTTPAPITAAPTFYLTSNLNYRLKFDVIFQESKCNTNGTLEVGNKNVPLTPPYESCNLKSVTINANAVTQPNCNCFSKSKQIKQGECPCPGCSLSGINLVDNYNQTVCFNPDSVNNCSIDLC